MGTMDSTGEETRTQSAQRTPEQILDLATVRRAELDLAYAGAVTPPEAWQLVRQQVAKLIDVRTAPEFKFVGRVPAAPNVEWHGGDTLPKALFLDGLRKHAKPDDVVLLICRSGVRSHAAANAAAVAGFSHVYNVLDGFEGERDALQQRGKLNGWRRHDLPWIQD